MFTSPENACQYWPVLIVLHPVHHRHDAEARKITGGFQDMTASSLALIPAFEAGDELAIPKRIVLFNVKYSPNLGDGLLGECLERELARALPGCAVVSIDLAGRSAYPARHGGGRGSMLALLDRCPPALRRIAARIALDMMLAVRLRRGYRAGLEGAEAVVVGGGNLLSDADLNFPVKLAGALAEAARAGLPVAVHAVGVAPHWSRAGTRLFAGAFARARLVSASVRDEASQAAWRRHFAGRTIAMAQVVVDPGMLASLHYPRAAPTAEPGPIGFCVTDPRGVRYHADCAAAAPLESWYPAALRALVEAGFEVALFTNGSAEDRRYLMDRHAQWIRHAKGPVTLQQAFDTPADLATFVSGCAAVVGHRLHACIAAHAFGVPAIGLRWDGKLDSFFALAGRRAHVLDPATVPAGEIAARVHAAMAERVDPGPLIARARREIAQFAGVLQDACK
jgi:polysaccharide pyruvyl transferase WcaK-like protein